MLKRLIILTFLLSGIYVYLSAQILPPVLNCVSNDTIHFTPVSNSCGPFLSYEIFNSTNENGPFTLLGTVSDPNASFFEHPNSAGVTNFYFIRPLFDCSGDMSINSDTISNRPPEVGLLHTVSVENNSIKLMWNESTSPETTFYNVFLFTGSGLEFLGQTLDNFFIDLDRDPKLDTFNFLIAAEDACGNRSIFGDPSANTLLALSIGPCINEISFNWNKHDLVQEQELWAITNTGEEIFVDQIPLNAEDFTIQSTTTNDIEYYFVQGYVFGNRNMTTRSNSVLNRRQNLPASNLDCKSPIIRLPNAFNPYGVNNIFKPLVGNANAIASYQMKIFSRYGELLYNSNDWQIGWNGRSGLREMAQGVYPYLIEIEVVGGENLIMRGTVLLIR